MEEVVQYCTKSKKYRKGRWTKGTIPDTSMEQKAKGCLFYLELFLEIEVPYAAVLPRVAPYKVNHLLAQSKSLDTSIAGKRRLLEDGGSMTISAHLPTPARVQNAPWLAMCCI